MVIVFMITVLGDVHYSNQTHALLFFCMCVCMQHSSTSDLDTLNQLLPSIGAVGGLKTAEEQGVPPPAEDDITKSVSVKEEPPGTPGRGKTKLNALLATIKSCFFWQ